ncbi:MAG: FtsW/RodA/SpoVE family cell cycle protein [bacterium]
MKREPDKVFIGIVFFLVAMGILMIFDASSARAYVNFNGDYFYYLKHHIIRLAISVMIFLFFYRIDYTRLREYSNLMLLFAIVSLICLAGLKFTRFGSHRVIRNMYGFQPSEFARLAMIVFLADKLSKSEQYADDFFQGFAPLISVVIFVVFLVAIQPSFGMAAVLLAGSLMMLFVGKVRIEHLLAIGLVGLIGVAILLLSMSDAEHYAVKRLKMFAGEADKELSFQINHSIAAIATGGPFGRGFGKSVEKTYLPEAHTDFIFSIIAEEFGFFFSIMVLLAYALLLRRGIMIAFRARDSFGAYLAFGITAFFFTYITMNILVTMKLLPTTGIPLPFLSFGGNSLFINMACCGILLNISRHLKIPLTEPILKGRMGFFTLREDRDYFV